MSATLPDDAALLAEAEGLLARAYSPYSSIRVAAVALAADGRRFGGVNVENSSLGLSICAERNALARAVAEGGIDPATRRGIVAVVFTSNHPDVAVPCGACRQVLHELAPGAHVSYGRQGRIVRTWASTRELLPDAFDGTWKAGEAGR